MIEKMVYVDIWRWLFEKPSRTGGNENYRAQLFPPDEFGAKNCKSSRSNHDIDHIFGPRWFEFFILEKGLEKVKIGSIFPDFPWKSHCKVQWDFHGRSGKMLPILTFSKPFSKMRNSNHLGPKIWSMSWLDLLDLQFLAPNSSGAKSCAR